MNPTRKPKKKNPKQVVDKPRKTNKPKKPKSMKKGGGWNWEKKIPKTPKPSDIPHRLEPHPRRISVIDALIYKIVEKCNGINDNVKDCITAYKEWQQEIREKKEEEKRREERDKKRKEKEKEERMISQQASQSHHSQSQRSSPRTSPQTSHHSQSHSSHIIPIKDELQQTIRKKRLSFKPLPPPQQPTHSMRRLHPLPPQVLPSSRYSNK
jgi:hypothetical protein